MKSDRSPQQHDNPVHDHPLLSAGQVDARGRLPEDLLRLLRVLPEADPGSREEDGQKVARHLFVRHAVDELLHVRQPGQPHQQNVPGEHFWWFGMSGS